MCHSLKLRRFHGCILTTAVFVGFFISAEAASAADNPSPFRSLYHTDAEHLWNRAHEALFVRIGPDGRAYGQDRLEPLLWNAELPQFPIGTEVALVRRMMLIDSSNNVVAAPLTESVQLRVNHGDIPTITATVLADASNGDQLRLFPLSEMSVSEVTEAAIKWKNGQSNWIALQNRLTK